MSSPSASIEQDIGHLILCFVAASKQHINAALDELDLTMAEGMALHHLSGPMPMRQLATEMGYDASHITGIVDRLESRGFVERRADSRDRRVKLLVVTERGHTVQREVERLAFAGNPILDRLTADQRSELRTLLELAVGPGSGHEGCAVDPGAPAPT